MAELATIARPYAEALFKACAQSCRPEHGTALGWAENWRRLPPILNCAQLADNPKITTRAAARRVFVTGAGPPDIGPSRNFLRTVIDNGRLDLARNGSPVPLRLVNQQQGYFRRRSCTALSHGRGCVGRSWPVMLEKRFGRKLHLSEKVDEC